VPSEKAPVRVHSAKAQWIKKFEPSATEKRNNTNTTKMRGKRSKQYRKLMLQYALGFGFREPYQVIVTSDIIQDAARFQMDLTGGLSRTLHGEIKPCWSSILQHTAFVTNSEK
jgi:hypothetical protein